MLMGDLTPLPSWLLLSHCPEPSVRDLFPPNKNISLNSPCMTVTVSLSYRTDSCLTISDSSTCRLVPRTQCSEEAFSSFWQTAECLSHKGVHSSPGSSSSSGQASRITETSMALYLQSFSLKTEPPPEAGRHRIPSPMQLC